MDRSGARRSCGRDAARLWPLLLFFLIAIGAGEGVASGTMPLQLEVTVNGYPTHILASFEQLPDGRLAAMPKELAELRIKTPPGAGADRLIALDAIGGLTYRYNAPRQSVAITIAGDGLLAQHLQAGAGGAPVLPIQSAPGAVLNYTLVGTLNEDNLSGTLHKDYALRTGFAANLEARWFGTHGTLVSSALVGTNLADDASAVRLETSWTTSDPARMLVWRAGDTVSGALAWTRPIRLGGIQLQRNFALRPDLITMPLPAVSGTAAVPSTVDVYINNVRAFSQSVQPGPFSIASLPAVAGGGVARVIVRDATGRETESSSPFYVSQRLLGMGVYDLSAETGFARRSYGTLSDDYDGQPVASASARYGWTDWLTLEGHAEVGAGVLNAGAGSSLQLGTVGVLSLAASLSHSDRGTGGQGVAAFETKVLGASLAASSQRTLGEYWDHAAVTAETPPPSLPLTLLQNKPRKALDWVTIGMPFLDLGGSLSFSFINSVGEASRDRILNVSYTRGLTDRAALFVTGFTDLDDGNTGLFAGVTISLGERGHVTAGLSHDAKSTAASAEYMKPAGREPGSFGWRIADTEGTYARRVGAATYQGSAARVEGSVVQQRDWSQGTVVVEGALATAGGRVFLANRIDDAFAVVDVGVPGVEVLQENRRVGTTDAHGQLLVTGLRSYQKNRIAIDPTGLPVDTDIPETRREVVPADRNGVAVDLKARRADDAGVVVLRSADGAFLPAGSSGRLAATGDAFVVGYDGRAFIKGLAVSNTVQVSLGDRACTAAFAFHREPGTQVVIDGVICR